MPIIDLHAHLGPCPWPVPSDDPSLLEGALDSVAIDLCVVHPTIAEGGRLARANADLAAAIEGHDRLAGCAWLDASYLAESHEAITAYLPRKNFRAAALALDGTNRHPLSLNVQTIVKALLRYSVPLVLHLDETTPITTVVELAERFAKVPFVLSGFGGSAWRQTLSTIERRTNLLVGTGGDMGQRDLLKSVVETVGTNRVVYGSNLPFCDPLVGLGMIRDADISAVAKDRILHRNARRLLHLDQT